MNQITDTVLMIAPTRFGLNEQAAESNSFQKKIEGLSDEDVQNFALLEFNNYVEKLKSIGVNVIVIKDKEPSLSPDSIFPNNWISFHKNGTICTYPMEPENRRLERRQDIIEQLSKQFSYNKHITFEHWEIQQKYMEGTGSIVLDHDNKLAYAAISSRTHIQPLNEICATIGYKPIAFHAYGLKDELIYHTNCVMCVGTTFVAVSLEIVDEKDRQQLKNTILQSGKELIELTKEQALHAFAGNMLQVLNKNNEEVLVVSQKAYTCFTNVQLQQLEKHNKHILSIPIPIIETYGGGSVRCMLAEVFY